MRRYSPTQEWVELIGDSVTIGITKSAAKEIGEIVFVELPQVGQHLCAGQEAAVLESTKAAIDICSPVNGIVEAVNDQLKSHIDLINQTPEGSGWLFQVKMADRNDFEQLMPLPG